MRRPAGQGLVLATLVGLASGACSRSDDRALVLFEVTVATDVPDFKSFVFTNALDPAHTRTVDGPSHRPQFQLGYYVANPKPTLTVVGRAVRADGCTVGEGSAMASGLAPHVQSTGGVLAIVKTEVKCPPAGGGQDGGDAKPDGGSDTRDAAVSEVPPATVANGDRCGADVDCMQGHCVDGVCCESACTGQCSACNEPSNAGKCLIVSGAPRSGRVACGGTAPCNAQCDGTDGMACKFPGNAVVCAAGSCTNGAVKTTTTCDGAGACTTGMTSPCMSTMCADTTKCAGGCTAGSCGAGKYCDVTGVCLSAKAAGQPCQAGSECMSTFCADGVCCGSACSGQCEACNEPNKVGMCVAIAGAPHGTRAGCTGTQAMCAGRCDGVTTTACNYPGGTTTCAAATCNASGMAAAASVCNGAGGCTTVTPMTCVGSTYCSGAACVPQLTNGTACATAKQCQSGNCSSGNCCPSGQTWCNGACANLASDGANCGLCGKRCAASSCSAGKVTAAATCNGSGVCSTPLPTDCSSNMCADATKCAGACTPGSSSCGAGKYCDLTGACQPPKSAGTACQSGIECTSGACVDGVCCNSACGGQCQACNEAGNVGTCVTVTGTPRGSRTACTGTQATCLGACNGALATACSYPTATTVCTAATCSGTTSLVGSSVCNGAGACTTPTTSPCGSGKYCSGAACIVQSANGSGCSTAPQCQSGNCTSGLCCANGESACNFTCKNLKTDSNNCGACGQICPGAHCTNGSLFAASTCNGAGVCSTPSSSPCPSSLCDNNSTCTPLPPAPVALWKFAKQATASTLVDSSGNFNDGNVLHGSSLTSPVFAGAAFSADRAGTANGALALDAVTSTAWAQFESSATLNAPWNANAISVTMWVRMHVVPTSGGIALFDRGSVVDATSIDIGLFNGKLQGHMGNYLTENPAAVPVNQWMFVALTYNGVDLNLYVDGALVGSFSNISKTLAPSNTPVTIGAERNVGGGYVTGYANGDFDEVRIYATALSANQVAFVKTQ
jgi:Concanavalin A-like lectin/glucanases superfamily